MPTSIAITGLSASYPIPGVFPQVQFAQGIGSSGQGVYPALLIANKSAAGSATPDTVIYGPDTATPLQTQADADALFGVGSEAAIGWARFTKFNQTTPLYVLCPTESVGAKATGTITLTGTATGAGTLRIYRRASDFVDVPINAGDTPTVIGAAALAAVNGKVNWPFIVSANAAGALTLQCKQNGLRGNWTRYWSRIFPACGTTTSTATVAFFTGGTTADSNAAALATIAAKRYYFVVSAAEDATQFGALMTQLNSQALATNNIRQTAFTGSVDTLANATTIATGLNNARATSVLLTQADYTPFELACQAAALEALGTSSTIPRMNYDNIGAANDNLSVLWQLDAPLSGAAPTPAQIASALNNGLSPIAVDSRGRTYLVSLITTRSMNGSNPDYQVRDNCKVFISDFYTDDLVAKVGAMMPGKNIANDPVGNQPAPGGATVTPRIVGATTNKLTRDYFDRGLLQNVDTIIAQSVILRESSPTTRMSIQVPLQVADVWHQTGIDIRQVA